MCAACGPHEPCIATKVGSSIRPGEPLVEIVAVNRGLAIKAGAAVLRRVVRRRQRALVKITANGYLIYGGLEGVVVGVFVNAIRDERTEETYYTRCIITKHGALLDHNGRKLTISAGMVTNVNLTSGSARL